MEFIERYTQAGREAFDNNELIRVWLVHHLQILGEAARSTPAKFRAQHPHIRWQTIIDARNLYVHVYFGVSDSRVWRIVEMELPALRDQIQRLMADGDRSEEAP